MSAFLWCDRTIEFGKGETVAAALLRAGIRELGQPTAGPARARVFCGIGACQACLVRSRDGAILEACITPARAGMELSPVLAWKKDGGDA